MKHKSIYKITNLVNQKVYIGQTVDFHHRWRQHKLEAKKEHPSMIVNQAMKKYGIDKFIFETICSVLPVSDEIEYCSITDQVEKELIEQYQSHVSTGLGYNVSRGGSTSPKTEEWKQVMKDHWANTEYKKKVVSKVRDTWSKKTPEELAEIAKKLSEASKGQHRAIGTEFKSGHEVSNELKQHLSDIHKGKRYSPKTEFQKGHIGSSSTTIQFTAEQLQQIKELRQQGVSYPKIGNLFNVSRSTISRLF